MITDRPPSGPPTARLAWSLLLAALLAGYFVAAHEMSRSLVGGFGSPAGSVLTALVGTLVGALPLVAVLPIALMPDWWWTRRLPAVRFQRGQCPDCGYTTSTFACPECGGDGRVPPQELFTRSGILRFLLLALVSVTVGTLLAEWRIRGDESAFMGEAASQHAAGQSRVSRPRAGWGSFATLRWDPAEGFTAPPPFEDPRIPGWRAAGRSRPGEGN